MIESFCRQTATCVVALHVISSAGLVSAQNSLQTATQVEILSPSPDSYVTGPTALRARVEPAEAVASLIFFVDGRQVCVLAKPPFECDWDPGASIREHQVRLVVNLNGGGRQVQTVRTKALDFSESVDVDVVQVTVTVADSRGKFVRGLPQSAFRVAEDGRPQTISHFASENVPLELIVAIDISGSMGGSMPQMKAAVKAFLTAVPSQHQITLLAFNDTLFTLARRATDLAERTKAVDRLAPVGFDGPLRCDPAGTRLHRGARRAARHSLSSATARIRAATRPWPMSNAACRPAM